MQSSLKTWLVSALLSLLLVTSVYGARSAEELIQQTGTQGGVVAHLGCGNGQLTADLCLNDRFLVHGLDTDLSSIKKAKARFDSLGIYGRVSAEYFDGTHLPYGDNIANLIVVENPFDVDANELERVLVPGGAALVKSGSSLLDSSTLKRESKSNGRTVFRKPWPDAIDEWTHFLHDSSGNCVSHDKRVGAPRHMQWYAGPRHSRHHDALASMSAMTSGNGRLFYIYDEGQISVMHRPPKWKLIARDAFNGKLLWKRDIENWMTHLYNFRAGPKQLPRRLVSVGDSVYATLGWVAPVSELDAATGKTRRVYEGSKGAEEIVYHDGVLLTVLNDPEVLMDRADGCHGYWELYEEEEPPVGKSIVAYDADSGDVLWRKNGKDLKYLSPLSLCARGEKVFYHDGKDLQCVGLKDGSHQWAAPFNTQGWFIRSYAPTVVAHEDVVMCLKWDRFCGYSIENGEVLWENKGSIGFGSPGDAFVIGDTVWTNPMRKSIWRKSRRNKDGIITTGIDIPKSDFLNQAKTGVGIDVHSGEIKELLPFAHTQHHHRCYRDKATEDHVLLGHSGIQLVDFETKKNQLHKWVRGICQYGVMPANGYIYVPPDPCQCYSQVKINGFFALSEHNSTDEIAVEPALEKGPAYSRISGNSDRTSVLANVSDNRAPVTYGNNAEWPTYRGNISRSGSTSCKVSGDLDTRWRVKPGGNLNAPVIAQESVYVASCDAYTVHCLDAGTGEHRWKYLANGPIDSPPTIYKGLCVFGCGDGSVYCLDAETGELAWRFKVSRLGRRVGSDDRLASPFSVEGSVLVQENTAYFAAGRSSNLDGGIRVYGVDVWTGELLHEARVASGHWAAGKTRGGLSDVLVSSGNRINMRRVHFDADLNRKGGKGTIVASTGLLDSSWFHRQEWNIPGRDGKGQLIVHNADYCCSVRNPYTGLKQSRRGQYKKWNQVGHFHQKFSRYQEEFFPVGTKIHASVTTQGRKSWDKSEDFQPRAAILAGDRLYLAGWLDSVAVELKSGRPRDPENPGPHTPVLRVYSAAKGKRIAEHALPEEPAFDGLAAAYKCLFISLKDGSIACMGR